MRITTFRELTSLTEQAKPKDLVETILQVTREKEPETVSHLVHLVKEKSPASEQEILGKITQLQTDGKLKLTQQSDVSPSRLGAYLKTHGAAWYWITLTLTLASVAAIFTIPVDLQPYVVIRNVLGIVFILWLPGYTFTRALFPRIPTSTTATSLKRTVQNLDTIERIALSIGLSLALVPMIGLLLYYTPWGINLALTVLSLAALTLVFATAAVLRENQQRKTPGKTQSLAPISIQDS
jgi:hypothetical protein